MKPKQRFMDAVHFKKPQDYVSSMELEFQITQEYVGRELIMGAAFASLSRAEKEKAHARNAEIMFEVVCKAGHDAVKELGGYWEAAPGVPAYMWLPTLEDRLDYVRAFKRVAKDEVYLFGNLGATMAIPAGDELYAVVEKLYDEPEEIHAENEKLLQEGIEQGKRLMDAGCDGIINASDIAFNSGTFLSTEMLSEFFFPYFNRWVDAVKSDGGIAVWHTDGNINKVIDKAIESGVHAIQCVDPLGGMDIVELKKQVQNKLCLIGNIDCSLLQLGTASEIEAACKKVIEGCKGDGGFVLSGCNAIFKGIPAENYQVLVDSRYKYGKE
ncbi:MAG: uroporphyrinogen decarboxylase family protein [Ruthenibacterium sp.]